MMYFIATLAVVAIILGFTSGWWSAVLFLLGVLAIGGLVVVAGIVAVLIGWLRSITADDKQHPPFGDASTYQRPDLFPPNAEKRKHREAEPMGV
jgi:hypothetical protein